MKIKAERILGDLSYIQREVAKIHLNPEKHGIKREVIIKEGDQKSVKDYTNAVDRAVETRERKFLLERYPKVGFLGEETEGRGATKRYRWIVDPTDGTAVFTTGGDYYSNVIALADRESEEVPIISVYQPVTGRQFIKLGSDIWVSEEIMLRDGTTQTIERIPKPSQTKGMPELMGCSFGTSKYYPELPGVKEAVEAVFAKERHHVLQRDYGIINARPASGSSAMFCCDIADGNRHFAVLYAQKTWDLTGMLIAEKAGCLVQCGPSYRGMQDNKLEMVFANGTVQDISGGNLEAQIATCDKKTLINAAVFANPHVRDIVIKKLGIAA